MPARKIDFPWVIAEDEPIVFTQLETVNCPRCHYRIPVQEEYTDYRVLYEESKKMYNQMVNGYDNLLKELSEINLDVKIDLELRRGKTKEILRECLKRFGKEYGE